MLLLLFFQGGWTEGKLYCPKCNARVGGFDFLHVVPCACEEDVLPAIWCVKSKVDHMQNSLIIAQHSSADGGDNTSNVKRSTVNSNVDSNVNPTLGQDNTDSGSSDAGKYNVQHRTETVVTECLLDTKASANGDVECSEIQQRSGKSHGYQHCSPETWGVCNPSINAHICKQHQCKSSHCHISTFGRGNHLGTKVTGQNFAGAENLTLYQGSISNHCLGDCCFFECCSHYRPDFYGIGKCHAAPEACKMHECCNGTICANSMCNCVRINEDTSEFPVSVQIFSGKDCTHAHCGGKKEASNLCEHKYTSLPCQERSIDYTGVGLGSNVNISKCCAGSLCCCSTHLHTLMNHGHCSLRNNSFSDTFCHEKQGAFEADIYEDFAEMRRHITSCYPTTYSMNNWEYRPKVFHRDRVSNRKRLQRIPRVKRGIVSRKRLSRRLSAASQQADDENSVGFVEREPKSLKNGKVKSSSGSTSVSANLNRFASLSCVDKRDSRHISDSEVRTVLLYMLRLKSDCQSKICKTGPKMIVVM